MRKCISYPDLKTKKMFFQEIMYYFPLVLAVHVRTGVCAYMEDTPLTYTSSVVSPKSFGTT